MQWRSNSCVASFFLFFSVHCSPSELYIYEGEADRQIEREGGGEGERGGKRGRERERETEIGGRERERERERESTSPLSCSAAENLVWACGQWALQSLPVGTPALAFIASK